MSLATRPAHPSPWGAATSGSKAAVVALLLSAVFALTAVDALAQPIDPRNDLGPVWVCFDESDPPPPEVLAQVERVMMEAFGKYNLTGRWPGAAGDPIALTWSLMPDGVMIPQSNAFDEPQQGALASNLFATMDGQFPNRAAWVSRIQQAFDRWEALTGINFTRVTPGGNAFDDGAAWGTAGDGVNRGDIRIGGRCIDGSGGVDCTGGVPTPGNILAYNQFPGNGGDQVIDTAENWFRGGTELFLRNTVMHELGHGIGLQHVCPTSQTKLMEPIITQNFDGPQHDDIRAGHTHYGDPFEGDGNSGAATNLGALTAPSPIVLGDFPAPNVANGSIHSIDADGESDWFRFTINGAESLDLSLAPIGLNYDSSTQNNDGTCNAGNFINSLTLANLAVEVIDTDATTVLTTVNAQGAGGTESLDGFALGAAGTYFLRVFEANAPTQSQLYSLSLDVNEPPVAECQDVVLSADADCCITVDVSDIDDGSFDPNGAGDVASLCITEVDGVPQACAASVEICELGAHTLELTITDLSGETSSCTATVTAVDTTPPVITCPADIVVECTQFGGTPADDAQLAPFFAGVSATDNCDASPTLGDDAPAFFPEGDTDVTFTATDDSGNMAQCTATVTVEDTTPPVITVSLNRDVLWPPNHKLVDIVATVEVTDICDPAPTFVLWSVSSSEPDDDNGDGNTTDDIQGADLGTPDTEFQLRSERDGRNVGRRYTIVYRASDAHGNTADATVFVDVPHDQSGAAKTVAGFTAPGTTLDPRAEQVTLVVLSTPRTVDVSIFGLPDAPTYAFHAPSVDVSRVYVGNTAGVAAPIASQFADGNDDGLVDLAVTYSADKIAGLLAASDLLDGPVGLHYRTARGEDVLVADIFALGAAVTLRPLAAGGDQPPTAVESQAGTEVAEGAAGTAGVKGVEGTPEVLGPSSTAPDVRRTGLVAVTPNPFNPATSIAFELDRATSVQLRIYTVQGTLVRSLVSGALPVGRHESTWDGRDAAGRSVASGAYLVVLDAAGVRQTRSALLLK